MGIHPVLRCVFVGGDPTGRPYSKFSSCGVYSFGMINVSNKPNQK